MDDRDRFAVVILADVGAAGETGRAVDLAGGRVMAQVGWDGVGEALARAETAAVLVLEAQGVAPERVEPALAAVAAAQVRLDCRVIAVLDDRQIDLVATALLGGSVHLLVSPRVDERVAALAIAAREHQVMSLSDVHEGEAERLRLLNEEVARIAGVLARLSSTTNEERNPDEGSLHDRRMSFGAPPPAPLRIDAAAVRRMIRIRRLRTSLFGPGLFEDPAWDIMLDLFAAEMEGVRVSVSSLCIAAAVPPTTALRWIGKMVDAGLLIRRPDPHDRRRAYMTLSNEASQTMERFFAAVEQLGLAPPPLSRGG